MTQRELAQRAGISASYLNLVELNKRPAGPVLLDRIAKGLDAERGLLDGEAERHAIGALQEIAADPVLAGPAPSPGSAEDLVSRLPQWADLLQTLYQAYLDEKQAVLALADRLNRDPFLGESVHRMLSNVTAIRSATEILSAGDALEREDRDRFMAIIASDTEKLSETARSMVAFFDNANMRVRSATPMEHVDAFIFEENNHFPALEDIATEFLKGCRKGETPEATALRLLKIAGPDRKPPALAASIYPEHFEARRFRLIRSAVSPLAMCTIDNIVQTHPLLSSEESRNLASAALLSYVTAAVLMPYAPFLEAAEQHRYDLDMLLRLFGVTYEQAAHRVATLRRPGSEGVRFAFMRSDASGYVTKRLPIPRLPLPRYGTACPLWPVYGAFQTGGTTLSHFGELPSGDQFLFFARAVEKTPSSANSPRHILSVMLACSAADADRVLYGDGINRHAASIPVGTVCRLCPRSGCPHRQDQPLIT